MEQLEIDLSDIPIEENYVTASQKAKWGKALQKYCDTSQTVGVMSGYCACGNMIYCDLCNSFVDPNACLKAIKELANKKQIEIDYRDFDFEKFIEKFRGKAMREILFRAKRVDNGEWVEGYYWQNEVGNHFIRVTTLSGEYVLRDYEVFHETVGQFTGLKDRKGTRIFNGDILERGQNSFIYGVHFYNGGYHIIDADGNTIKPTQKAVSYMQVEIIGNIHDNPELIEVEE
ncbi:MAG: YopX family protein [Clostridia bacterium]